MFERFNGNVVPFADESTSTNRTVFGSETQSDDIDDNLNSDFKKGWEIVGLNDNPTREDFNAMGYTLGYLISYLYQNGVAEYNLLQEYKTSSIAIGADGNIYQSLVDSNLGNALTDTTKWVCIASKNSIVNSIAELKTISNIESINVLGYYEKGDGGGGTFYWDATSTETDNGGTIIQATGITTGRWKRVFSGAVNVKWFGAKGDGVVANEAVSINKAIASINSGEVLFPPGTYNITETISITKYIRLVGAGSRITTIHRASDVVGILISGTSTSYLSLSSVGVSGMSVNGQNTYTTDSIQISYVALGRVSDVVINNNGGNGLYLRSTQDCVFENIYIRYCGNQDADTSALYLDTYSNEASSSNNNNDNKFIACTFEHGTGRLVNGVGAHDNTNTFITCKFEPTNVAVTAPIVLVGASRYSFESCRYTHYNNAPSFFDITSCVSIIIDNGLCYNDNNPALFVRATSSKDIKVNVHGRKIGGYNFGNSTASYFTAKDYEANLNVELISSYNENQNIPLSDIFYSTNGSTLVVDDTAPDGVAIVGSGGTYTVTQWIKICNKPMTTNIMVRFYAKATVATNIEILTRGTAGDTIISTPMISNSYAWHSVIIPYSLLTKNTLLFMRVAGTATVLTIGAISYSSKLEKSSIPTNLQWEKGSIIYNSNPSSGASIGWVCTTSGTPGTWKSFGTIGA